MVRTKDSEVVGGMTLLRGWGMVRTNEGIGSGNGVRENKGGGRRRRERTRRRRRKKRRRRCDVGVKRVVIAIAFTKR